MVEDKTKFVYCMNNARFIFQPEEERLNVEYNNVISMIREPFYERS